MKHFKIKLKSAVKFSLNGFETISYAVGTHTVSEEELKTIKKSFAKSLDGKPTETAAPKSEAAADVSEADIHERVAALEEQIAKQAEVTTKLLETVDQLSAAKEAAPEDGKEGETNK